MNTRSLVCLALCLFVVEAMSLESSAAAQSMDDIVLHTRNSEERHVRFQTTYTYRTLEPVPVREGASVDSMSATQGKRSLEGHTAFLRYDESRYRIDLILGAAPDSIDSPVLAVDPTVNLVWNGEQWFEKHVPSKSFQIHQRPQSAVEFDCMSHFHVCDGPGLVGGWTVSDTIHNMNVSRIIPQGKDRVQLYLTTSPDARVKNDAVIVLVRPTFDVGLVADDASDGVCISDDELVVERIQYDLYTKDAETGEDQLTARIVYQVREWERYGDRVLPKVATRDGYSYRSSVRGRDAEPFMTRSIFTRLEYHVPVERFDESIFELQPAE